VLADSNANNESGALSVFVEVSLLKPGSGQNRQAMLDHHIAEIDRKLSCS